MYKFSGLKLNIAVTITLILLASMVLGNFVTVMFWKKNLIDFEINQARSLTTIMGMMIGEKLSRGDVVSPDDLQKYIYERENIISAAFFDGKRIVFVPEHSQNQHVEQAVRRAGVLQKEAVRLDGSFLMLFSTQKPTLLVARPVEKKGLKNHAFCVQVDLRSVYKTIFQDLKTVVVYLVVNAIILFVVGWYRLAGMVVKPIERMVAASDSYEIADGVTFEYDSSTSEIGQLSMALNSMLFKIELDRKRLSKTVVSLELANKELVETQQEMVLAEKLVSVGRLAAGLAHEIGNPLGIVQGYVELLGQSDISEENRVMYAHRALKELDRINALIRQLLDFARTSKNVREYVSIVDIFDELRDMLLIQSKGVVFEIHNCAEVDTVRCDRDGLRQVFLNCLLNSLDAIEACEENINGLISVTLSDKIIDKECQVIVVKIEDNGIGVRGEMSLEYFEPFYTTKEPGKGTGLGLSVSHTIIESHNGSITIDGKKDGSGAVVTIELPFNNKQEVEKP